MSKVGMLIGLVMVASSCRADVAVQSAIALELPGVIVRHMVTDPSTGDVWISLGEVPGLGRVSSVNGGS